MTKLEMSGMKARGDDFANVEPVLAVSVSSIGILRSVGDGARAVTSPSVGVKPAGQNPESTKGALQSRSVCSGNPDLGARKYGFVGCFGRGEQLLVATRSSFSKGAL